MQLMKYMKLDQKGNLMAEYVWIDAIGEVRSKSRVSLLCSKHAMPCLVICRRGGSQSQSQSLTRLVPVPGLTCGVITPKFSNGPAQNRKSAALAAGC